MDDSEKATAYFFRGGAHASERDFDRAIADYSEAIRLKPADAANIQARAGAYLSKQDYAHAIADYDKLLSILPLSHHAYRGRAKAWAALGETAKAEADNQKADEARAAMEKRGQERSVISNCSYTGSNLGPDWRIDTCTKALALPHDTPGQKAGSYRFRGLAYIEKKDADRAIADFDEAIRLAPDFAGFYGNRGDAYQLKKDYGHAIADYSKAIALQPEGDPAFYSGRAAAYAAQGDADRAKADRSKAEELGNKALALRKFMECSRGPAADASIAACTEALAMPVLAVKHRAYVLLSSRSCLHAKRGRGPRHGGL